jgi:hypothetical protein
MHGIDEVLVTAEAGYNGIQVDYGKTMGAGEL